MTTTDPAINKLRDAIQEYMRAEGSHDDVVLTDFVGIAAGIRMSTAEDQTHFVDFASGKFHSTYGLAHMVAERFDLTGDNE